MKVYQPLNNPDEKTGKFYKEYEFPDGVSLNTTLLDKEPPKDMLYPKWDYSLSQWIEDKDSALTAQKTETKDISQRLEDAENAIMELMMMITSILG